MLDTRKLPVSPRTYRPDASAGRAASSSMRSVGNVAFGEAAPAPRPPARPAAAPRQSRLGRSEMRLMGVATTCTAVVCGLLLLYLAAYAHVTRLGIDQASARGQLRENRLKNEMLRAERDRLQSPQRVIAAATALGMMPRGSVPIQYIAAPWHGERMGQGKAKTENQGEQGTSGGTTADSLTTAPFDH